jgi:Na+-transporting methylmalonyl-CoA/oxaloacetate decarboxylase gamma subunit
MRTPAGNPLTDPVELTARVSTLTGLGRVFTVGAMLVLVSWWFSYFRRRKKNERRAAQAGSRTRHPAHTDDTEIELSPDAAEARVAERHEANSRGDEVDRDEH